MGDHQLRRMFFYGALGGTVGFWLGIAFMPIAHPVEIFAFPANEAMDRRFYLYLGMCSSLAFLCLGGIVALVVWMLQFVVGVLVHLRNRFEHGAPAGSGEASSSTGPGGSGEEVR